VPASAAFVLGDVANGVLLDTVVVFELKVGVTAVAVPTIDTPPVGNVA